RTCELYANDDERLKRPLHIREVAPGKYYVATQIMWRPKGNIFSEGGALYDIVTVRAEQGHEGGQIYPDGTVSLPLLLVVAVALVDADNRVLIAQRPADKMLGGLWEFPGGK